MPAEIWRPPLTVTFDHLGLRVELIPLEPRHRGPLVDGFSRMSARSRYYRFMAPVTELSEAAVSYLTDLDMVDRFAWGAVVDGEPAAVGRYARLSPAAAEVAVTVLDEFQGMGIGPVLVSALATVARSVGFTRLEFEVLSENRPMLRILDDLEATVTHHHGVAHAEVAVGTVPPLSVGDAVLLETVETARAVLAET